MYNNGGDVDVAAYLPSVVGSAAVLPSECVLSARYNQKSNKIRFTYSVTWEETKEEEHKVAYDGTSEAVTSVESNGSKGSDSTGVVCDGPCGRPHRPGELTVLGRCGHYLCENCRYIVVNPDGTEGCSSFDCYRAMMAGHLPHDVIKSYYDEYVITMERERQKKPEFGSCGKRKKETSQRRRHENGETSVSLSPNPRNRAKSRNGVNYSSAPPSNNETSAFTSSIINSTNSDAIVTTASNEVICVRVIVIEPGPHKTIRRTHFEREIPASESVLNSLKMMANSRLEKITETNFPGNIHFIRKRGSPMQEIPLDKLSTMRLLHLPARNSTLHFVVDFHGDLKTKN